MDTYEAYMEVREDQLGLVDEFPEWYDLSEDERRQIRSAWHYIYDKALDEFVAHIEKIVG